jgi:hypothetical protein
MTPKSLEARPDPRPLSGALEQGIRSLESAIFNTYLNGAERNDAFKQLQELATALGRMTTRTELAEAQAKARTQGQVVAEEAL